MRSFNSRAPVHVLAGLSPGGSGGGQASLHLRVLHACAAYQQVLCRMIDGAVGPTVHALAATLRRQKRQVAQVQQQAAAQQQRQQA